jgi:hypothetical protein
MAALRPTVRQEEKKRAAMQRAQEHQEREQRAKAAQDYYATPGASPIELLSFVIDALAEEASGFALEKSFQPSLICESIGVNGAAHFLSLNSL